MTEYPAGDFISVLQSIPRHADVSHPMTKSPLYDKVSVVGMTMSPVTESPPGNEHLCNVMQPCCGGCGVGVQRMLRLHCDFDI